MAPPLIGKNIKLELSKNSAGFFCAFLLLSIIALTIPFQAFAADPVVNIQYGQTVKSEVSALKTKAEFIFKGKKNDFVRVAYQSIASPAKGSLRVELYQGKLNSSTQQYDFTRLWAYDSSSVDTFGLAEATYYKIVLTRRPSTTGYIGAFNLTLTCLSDPAYARSYEFGKVEKFNDAQTYKFNATKGDRFFFRVESEKMSYSYVKFYDKDRNLLVRISYTSYPGKSFTLDYSGDVFFTAFYEGEFTLQRLNNPLNLKEFTPGKLIKGRLSKSGVDFYRIRLDEPVRFMLRSQGTYPPLFYSDSDFQIKEIYALITKLNSAGDYFLFMTQRSSPQDGAEYEFSFTPVNSIGNKPELILGQTVIDELSSIADVRGYCFYAEKNKELKFILTPRGGNTTSKIYAEFCQNNVATYGEFSDWEVDDSEGYPYAHVFRAQKNGYYNLLLYSFDNYPYSLRATVPLGGSDFNPDEFDIKFVTPSAGANKFAAGSDMLIQWTVSGGFTSLKQVSLYFSSDGGKTFPVEIARNISADPREFTWRIPSGIITACGRLRLAAEDVNGCFVFAQSDVDLAVCGAAPMLISLNSESAPNYAGNPVYLNAELFDWQGAQNISKSYLKLIPSDGGVSLLVCFDFESGSVYLVGDDLRKISAEYGFASANTLSAKSCILDCAKIKVNAGPQSLFLRVPFVFLEESVGKIYSLFARVTGRDGNDSGWQPGAALLIENPPRTSLDKALSYVAQSMDKYKSWDDFRLIEDFSSPYPSGKQFNASVKSNALAVIAFLSRSTEIDRLRARRLLETFLNLQNSNSSSLYWLFSAYHAQDLAKTFSPAPAEPADMAWVSLAILHYYRFSGDKDDIFMSKLLDYAQGIAEIMLERFYLGDNWGFYSEKTVPAGKTSPVTYKGYLEHNACLYAAFTNLFEITKDARWLKAALAGESFVERLYSAKSGLFLHWLSVVVPDFNLPLVITPDTAAISYSQDSLLYPDNLGMLSERKPDIYPAGPAIEDNFKVEQNGFQGFDADKDKDGICWEMTAQSALAYLLGGNSGEYLRYLAQLESAQQSALNNNGQAIVQANKDNLTAGAAKCYASPNLSATSWFVLAKNGYNPFWGRGAQNARPCAKIKEVVSGVDVGIDVVFDASGSFHTAGLPIISYSWKFSDGLELSGQVVKRGFDFPGSESVILTVSDNKGNKDYALLELQVVDKSAQNIIAFAGYDQTVSLGQALTLSALGSSASTGAIVSYSWNMGDGKTLEGPNVNYTYSTAGVYSVELSVKGDQGGVSKDICVITVKPLSNKSPVASAGADKSVSVNEQIAFDASSSYDSDGSITRYFWSFGNGAFAEGKQVACKYDKAGTYTATLTVTDNSGVSAGDSCVITVQESILDTSAPQGSITINNSALWTDSLQVMLSLSAVDFESGMGQGAQMCFSNDGVTWSTPEAYQVTKTWLLSSGEGVKTVYVKFKDASGNWMVNPVSDTIAYIPALLPAPTVNPFSRSTNQEYIFLSGTLPADAKLEITASTSAYAGEVYYPDSRSWSCTVSSLKQGENVITLVAQDAQGRKSVPAVVSITVDYVAPRLSPYAELVNEHYVDISFDKEVGMEQVRDLYDINPRLTWNCNFLSESKPLQAKLNVIGLPVAGERYTVELNPLRVRDLMGNALDDNYSKASFIGSTSGPATLLNIFEIPKPYPCDQISFGYDVSSVGDVNGDGYADFAVTGRRGLLFPGYLAIYYGGPDMDNTADFLVELPHKSFMEMEIFVTKAGDVNGDGYDDFIVQMDQTHLDISDEMVDVYLYLGAKQMSDQPAFKIADVRKDSPGFIDNIYVAGLNDVNGDGYDDILVSNVVISQNDKEKFSYVYFGAKVMDNNPDVQLISGEIVASAGGKDINGDGVPDFVLVKFNEFPLNNTSSIYVFNGGGNISGQPDMKIIVNAFYFARWVALGDINGDKCADILITKEYGGGGVLYLGGTNMDDKYDVKIMVDDKPDVVFASAPSIIEDINNDGYGDIIFASPTRQFGSDSPGKVFVYLGNKNLVLSENYALNGFLRYEYFGSSVSIAGDVNGDGYNEILVGSSNQFLSYPFYGGRAYLYTFAPLGPWLSKGVAVIDDHTIEIGFSEAVKNALNPGNYTITPSLGNITVRQMSPNFFRLITSAKISKGTLYTLTANNISNLSGKIIDSYHNKAVFSSQGEKPLVSGFSIGSKQLNGYLSAAYFDLNMSGYDPDGKIVGWLVTDSSTSPSTDKIPLLEPPVNEYKFNCDFNLWSDGPHSVFVWALDDKGNVSELSGKSRYDFILDTADPEITITSPKPGSIVGKDTVDICGYVKDANWPVNVKLSGFGINGREETVQLTNEKNTFEFRDVKFTQAGLYGVAISATDLAGNHSNVELKYTLDRIPPSTPAVTLEADLKQDKLTGYWVTLDNESGIKEYKCALGSSSGAADLIPWASNGTAQSLVIDKINLKPDTSYFLSVIAVNEADLESPVGIAFVKVSSLPDGDLPDFTLNLPEGSILFSGEEVRLFFKFQEVSPEISFEYRFLIDEVVKRDWDKSAEFSYVFSDKETGARNLKCEARLAGQVKSYSAQIFVTRKGIKI